MQNYNEGEINNKVVVITGGARGIGLAIAMKFHENKYRIALIDRDEKELNTTNQNLHHLDHIQTYVCDVSVPDQVKTTFENIIKHFDRVDALINNAGIAIFIKADEITFEEWYDVMATNLDGPFLCTQFCMPSLLKTQSCVVNIASISGVRASTLRMAYGTSKAALMHLTKQQAVEYGNQGIRVNAVAPGPVETEMAKLVHSADISTSYADAIPLERYGSVEEIANVVYFLCSHEASYVNGQIICVDGGFDAAGVGLPSLRT